jgi:hypothetical protein
VTAIAPTRATALASALTDYSGCMLYPHCARYRVPRQLSVNILAGKVGGTLGTAAPARGGCR